MSDTLVSLFGRVSSTPQATPPPSAGQNRPSRTERPIRSFADVAKKVNVPPVSKEAGKTEEDQREPDKDAPEELAMVTVLYQRETQVLIKLPDAERETLLGRPHPGTTCLTTAMLDEIADDQVDFDAGHLSAPARTRPTENRADGMRTDYAKSQGFPEENYKQPPLDVREVLLEKLQNTESQEVAVKELSASAIAVHTRLSSLTQQLTRNALPVELHASRQRLAQTEAIPSNTSSAEEGVITRTIPAATDSDTSEAELPNGDTTEESTSYGEPTRAIPARDNVNNLFALTQKLQPASETKTITWDDNQPVAQVVRQIVETTAVAQKNNVSQIRLQLNPEFLGRVSILLTSSEDGLSARIQAQSGTVRELLLSNLNRLQSELRDMGINMKSIDITGHGLGSDLSQGGRFLGRNRESEGQGTTSLVTMARFHQPIRSLGVLMSGFPYGINTPYEVNSEGGVDFWA